MKVKIKLIEGGKLPEFKHSDDACCDCYARVGTEVKAGERKLVPLGFALELPIDYEAVIRPRSGLTSKGIDSAIGTIDAGYRGEVMACIINNSDEDIDILEGARICQMAIRKVPAIEFEVYQSLSTTERGDKGFGSTGV